MSEKMNFSASSSSEKSVEQTSDFAPEIVEKAQEYRDRILANETRRVDTKAELVGIDQNDPQRRTYEKTLRQTDKEQSIINSELFNAEDNLARAENQVFVNFMDGVEGNKTSTPERVIAGFDNKRSDLTASIDEANISIRKQMKARHLNTRGAYEDNLLGSQMKDRDELVAHLNDLNEAWTSIGGDKVDKAREMVAIKNAYDQLPEDSQNAEDEPTTTVIFEGDNQEQKEDEPVVDENDKEKTENESTVIDDNEEKAEDESTIEGNTSEEENSQEQEDEPDREAYLKYMAESQKLHWNKGRIKTNGKLAVALRGLGADNLVDQLTQSTEEEEKLKTDYNKYLETKQKEALKDYEEGSEEFYEARAKFLTEQYAKDTQKIAELQKDNAKKPMNKWLRRAGYAGAGVAGGLIALTPLGLVGGAAAAAGGAIALRRNANKRNALTESKDGEGLVVDQLAKERATKFGNNASEHKKDYDANTITDWHEDDKKTEIDKNRRQMLVPVLGAVAVSLATKYGIDFAQENINSTGNTDPNTEPTDTATTETPKGRVEAEPSDIGSEAPVIPESASNIPEYTGGYPWDWASDLVGSEQATSELHRLTEIASQNGYDVVWNGLGDGVDTNDWISINGNSDSEYVVNILRQYL